MKKLILILSIILFAQANKIMAQTIELQPKLYLCENGSLVLDGTVINTSDTNITYQWYHSLSLNVPTIPSNEIAGATNPLYTVTSTNNGVGYYKVLATLSTGQVYVDTAQIVVKDVLENSFEVFECNFAVIEELNSYYYLDNTTNITFQYYEFEADAILGNTNTLFYVDLFLGFTTIYLRIEEANGACIDILPLDIDTFFQPLYAGYAPDMGFCSSEFNTNTFDLTINDEQILNGQTWAEISYFIDYNDAWNLENPIANPASYTALTPSQTIFARIYDPNASNIGCDANDSITQFHLLSISEPTPNTEVNYIVCDNSSGSDSDGIGAFDLTSKNSVVLSGLSMLQFDITYHLSLVDAQNGINQITAPNNFISGNALIYVRVASNVNACFQISQLNLLVQDTCDDLEVHLVSYWTTPRPGFSYKNKLIVKNNGETTIDAGSVTFTKDALVTFSGATGLSAGNTITPTTTGFILDFIDLLPGESEIIFIDLLVSTSADLGDLITNVAEYTTSTNDVTEENNIATLSEIIVGSYDPNDIVESHGPEIEYANFTEDDYLYYTIRFQNIGTASAINITIDNLLDESLDKTTFQMLSASHSYGIERDFDNLTWEFNNINLADATSDEPNSHGYVYYKIKPLAGYVLGDIVPNMASIVFDFNSPIITNTFNTEFVATLGIQEDQLNAQFLIMPNPAKESVTLVFNSRQSQVEVVIYDVLGKLVLKKVSQQSKTIPLNVSSLERGVYFVKIRDDKGQLGLKKLIKK
ncbi:hypothetical protein DI383_06415 [Flavobacteriaceae bacterium LYZ1037]|nr:hypothetical protein DI383_06415 [Flavobacteriaceae bacterium LYZ1037]